MRCMAHPSVVPIPPWSRTPLLVTSNITWLEKYFERAALDFFRFARIDEVPDGQDQGTRGQNFGMPAVGKGAVE